MQHSAPPPGQRASWVERTIELPAIRLHIHQLDAGDSLLVLLHGFSVNGTVWQGVGRRLSPPFTLIAPDLRGNGKSVVLAGGFRVADYAQDVADLAVALGREHGQANLLGHSHGAIAALGGAALAPAAVRKLVLVDPPLDGSGSLRGFLGHMVEARGRGDPSAVRALVLEREPHLSETMLRAYLKMWSDVADGALAAMLDDRDPEHIANWYGRVTAPALILRAEERLGGVCSEASAERARRAMPNARVVTVEGASHNIHASKPVEFARNVLEFLA